MKHSTNLGNAGDNPFPPSDADRHEIWEILMRHDFEGFVAGDWKMLEPDFAEESFLGIDARKSADPDEWRIAYPTVESYRDEWLRQVEAFCTIQLRTLSTHDFLYRSAHLDVIEIAGNRALAHKKFDGCAETVTGETVTFRWQSLFQMIRIHGTWKIAGFIGYLPNPLESGSTPSHI